MMWPDEAAASTVQRIADVQAILALERSGTEAIAVWQRLRLAELVQWLLNHSAVWRARLGERVELEQLHQWPMLSRLALRKMVQEHGPEALPESHGSALAYHQAGPPGGPVHFYTSAMVQRMVNHAFYADHQRQGRNPYAVHACVADDVPLHEGLHMEVAASLEHGTGSQYLRHSTLFTWAAHANWLQQLAPSYLTVTPQNLDALLTAAHEKKLQLPELRQILTYGSQVSPTLRARARQQLGASVRHRYTCLECGPLAFQCPRSEDFYHVAVANVLLEVVNDANQATPDAGRILVTALHQYATPLIRHDIGDRAALHNQCPGCELAVPALSRLQQGA